MSEPIRCFFLEPTGRKTEPRKCDCGCGETIDGVLIYRRTDTGEEMPLADAPAGAMWYADWYLDGIKNTPDYQWYRGPDGRCLIVRVPNGRGGVHDWSVDSRCSNCTLPSDNVHKCWVRHGDPPNVTVDKNGATCQAGAGSIGVWNENQTAYAWHGFLRNGHLVEA